MNLNPLGFNEPYAVLGVLALVTWGAIAGTRRAHRRKEMEHLERMRAMELGVAPAPVGMDWPAASVCIAIGAGVPIGSFAICWLATLTTHVPSGIFVAPVFVSFAAIGAARKLAHRVLDPRSGATKPAYARSAKAGKPEFDPDAFDVVGSRG
jgi:hypothetical protein